MINITAKFCRGDYSNPCIEYIQQMCGLPQYGFPHSGVLDILVNKGTKLFRRC